MRSELPSWTTRCLDAWEGIREGYIVHLQLLHLAVCASVTHHVLNGVRILWVGNALGLVSTSECSVAVSQATSPAAFQPAMGEKSLVVCDWYT